MRGPLGWAEPRGQNLQLRCADRTVQNCGEAPLTLGCFAPFTSPRAAGERWGRTSSIVLATHVRPSFAGTTRKKPDLIPS